MSVLKPLFIITPVLLVLAAGIILFVFKYQRRMLQHQEHLRQLQETRQRQLLDATMQTQEEERRRVARDLHDEVGAMLALVKLNTQQLTAQFGNQEDGKKIKHLLDDVMASVRHISHDLMPVVLEKMGLVEALAAMKKTIPASAGVEMIFNCNEPHRRLEPRTELFLYRVIQELFNNTLKHAEATTILVNLIFMEGNLKLEFVDNGKGFDYQEIMDRGDTQQGLGFMNLQARVELLDGTFQLNSAPDAGTKAEILIPIS